MARLFDYPEAKCVVVSGDIHGDFHTLTFKMCNQYQMTDTLLIVAGDCGFGFNMPGYYDQVYRKDVIKLRKANNWIAFVRGNHDNPAYFNEERIVNKRWKTIPDYAIITACGHNILCVGGGISIDREQRKKQQVRHSLANTGYYWKDEAPVFSKEIVDELPLQIDTIVTHSAPSFCEKQNKNFLNDWAEWDETLLDDVKEERETLDRLHDYLLEKGHPLKEWYYGHFHESWTGYFNEVKYKMLDIMEFAQIASLELPE